MARASAPSVWVVWSGIRLASSTIMILSIHARFSIGCGGRADNDQTGRHVVGAPDLHGYTRPQQRSKQPSTTLIVALDIRRGAWLGRAAKLGVVDLDGRSGIVVGPPVQILQALVRGRVAQM